MHYLLLFLNAFAAATMLPLPSEIFLTTLLAMGHSALLLWCVATSGNTLGACVNWLLGCYLLRFADAAWFPVSRVSLQRAEHWFQRYGTWTLLFTWLPIIGDALTVIAGTLRVRFYLFFTLTLIGKGGRYAFVVWVYQQVV